MCLGLSCFRVIILVRRVEKVVGLINFAPFVPTASGLDHKTIPAFYQNKLKNTDGVLVRLTFTLGWCFCLQCFG